MKSLWVISESTLGIFEFPLGVMYHISLCTSVPNSVPLYIGPTLLQRVRALHHSVTTHHSPSRPVTLRHFPSFSVTSLYFPSSFTIFRLHCNLGYVPSSGYDPYPYQLKSPFIILGLVAFDYLLIFPWFNYKPYCLHRHMIILICNYC